ncbi:MAG: 16S rRNA (cytosine(1402)-N(4))-methyltransferase RsmH [Candidatus Omnitrophota bacterium]
MPENLQHIPVMREEVLKFLNLSPGCTVVDGTVGLGGHAQVILDAIGPQGRFVGLDFDHDALAMAQDRLKNYTNCTLVHANFRNLDTALAQLHLHGVDGILLDLGISSLQLEKPSRGFSIKYDSPLDMRMNQNEQLSAFDLVNFLPQENLSDILRKYGQERWHNRIARAIVRERSKSTITSTGQLAQLVMRVVPYRYSKIHPATRTFQALRIAVNDELEALREALKKCLELIKPGGRICIIAFHSLEDGLVKHQFRSFASEGRIKIITKKPITPTEEEVRLNPRARSAKLRAAERIA